MIGCGIQKRQNSRLVHCAAVSFLHEWRQVHALPIMPQSTVEEAGVRKGGGGGGGVLVGGWIP